MSDAADLISGDALKASAQRFLAEVRAKVDQEQGGLLCIFDSWFSRVLTKLSSLDREQPWEDSVKAHAAGMSGPARLEPAAAFPRSLGTGPLCRTFAPRAIRNALSFPFRH
jgi:hypothetical protein